MSTQITLQELAVKLEGNFWEKGDLKRIYLDKGFNTKKMSTKTYVYQRQDGSFGVSCNIDCPSQHDNWIESQENDIIESVERQIEEIIELSKLTLVDYKITSEKNIELLVYVKYENEVPVWYNEENFYDKFNNYPGDVFEGLPEIQNVNE